MPWLPSIVPKLDDREIYLVLDDFGGRLGRAWPEASDGKIAQKILNLDTDGLPWEGLYVLEQQLKISGCLLTQAPGQPV